MLSEGEDGISFGVARHTCWLRREGFRPSETGCNSRQIEKGASRFAYGVEDVYYRKK